jgi:hypothetical protein
MGVRKQNISKNNYESIMYCLNTYQTHLFCDIKNHMSISLVLIRQPAI